MRMMKGGKLIAAILAVFSCIAIVWSSCKKSSSVATCNYYVCQNGGYCHIDTLTKKPACVCPLGYEGANCSVQTVQKYMDTWDMTEIITGSDSTIVEDTLHYRVELRKTATLTTFFILNFSNNPYYTSILCTMDSLDSRIFRIDTMSAKQLFYDHYHLVKGSGTISPNDSVITADLITKHLSPTSNWLRDTFKLIMTRHH